ncbi:hypothetical protein EJB05_47359 [Eragrostis curvula]|uniref:Uncharacterized protein n=1 Tax=Eragrostis curvula TaxID=38414 RepID=A0A5J9T7K8_9POAL|nr:hypothetical protein EJB05_47359 [Eragrostis curvula]
MSAWRTNRSSNAPHDADGLGHTLRCQCQQVLPRGHAYFGFVTVNHSHASLHADDILITASQGYASRTNEQEKEIASMSLGLIRSTLNRICAL